jgi:hypothetical protein
MQFREPYLAKLNNTNGTSSNWATANSTVEGLLIDGSNMYVCGSFTQLNGVTHDRLGGVVISSGNNLSFSPDLNSTVYGMAKTGIHSISWVHSQRPILPQETGSRLTIPVIQTW